MTSVKSAFAALAALIISLAPDTVVCTPVKRSQGLVNKFSSLVIFGDSYTDDGVHSYTPPVAAQSSSEADGGWAWPSYVQQYSGVNLYDYAVSGAVCDSITMQTVRNGIKQDQMPTFLSDNSFVNKTTGKTALINHADETVYAIWIGTNDLGYDGFLTEVQPRGMPLTYFTDCVYTQLDRLHAIGARNFVLMNVVPLELTPEFATPQNGGLPVGEYWTWKSDYDANITQSSEKIREYATMVNAVYKYQTPYSLRIANRYPDSSFAIYDLHSLITDVWENPANYLNGTVPYNVTSSIHRCGSPCDSDAVRDSYMWYDDLHPSEQTDRVVAREFVEVVKGQSKWATYWQS
ncbi:uncharacterized protein N7483_011554 [Penicillium malachiteum]|uniref:uncharacterized protein n=1 Tax=Penicillium malachiteum TaxID=1324776 RepID=UPI002548D724|nr:uncharacterized protein N7483_011554 [Penicillium malachiteum]KAJ5714373.1 hypothetical protein N7483_011554 [Penicillium malachiteum]